MKNYGWALAASLLLASAPLQAQTQASADREGAFTLAQNDKGERDSRGRKARGKPAAAAAGADTVKGMAEAPAVVQAAGLKCALSEAAYMGASAAGEKVYEVACSDGPGYVLITNPDATIKNTLECVQLRDGNAANAASGKADPNALTCKLPGNADPVRGLSVAYGPLVAGCTVDGARWLGATNGGKDNLYEIGCAGRPGAVIKTSAGAAPDVTPCERTAGNLACQLTSAEERLAPMRALATASGRACQVSDSRYVGTSPTTKENYYELKCGDGAGFMAVANANGSFNRAIDCARAQNVSGGCTLTDAVEAQNAEAGVYKGLATKAGFNCDVDQYRILGAEAATKREVVELSCKGRPEGVIAFFPVSAGGKTDFYDCTKVSYRKLNCSLTKPEATYPRLTSELQGKGRQCQVTGVRGVGIVASRSSEFVEVACANGPGFMLEYVAGPAFPAPKTVIPCTEAKEIGDGCKLASR